MTANKKTKETRARAKPGDKRLGNQFWKFRTKHGANKIFSDPVVLWEECTAYFQWCEDHPLMAAESVKFQGEATLTMVPKMRAMTITGLCFYLRISIETWRNYKKDKDLFGVICEAEQTIYDQKFTGAAADMLNANIIARDLGLTDKQDVTVKDESEIQTPHEVMRRLAFMMRKGVEGEE